ncbi:MAG: hypothetical protein QGI17_07710 [Arenicellales bacterium]|nr:hypothetical protein [Pseudomonadales bacterium]MDP7516985.1 hypothetical protein [Arenicellales bacterium]HJP45071.1 hypothetical protein [Arenicellales bacterium]
MCKPVIITCTVTGNIPTPTLSPYLPITSVRAVDAAIYGIPNVADPCFAVTRS